MWDIRVSFVHFDNSHLFVLITHQHNIYEYSVEEDIHIFFFFFFSFFTHQTGKQLVMCVSYMYSAVWWKEGIFCLKVKKFDHTRDGDSVEVDIHTPTPRPSITTKT